MTAKTTTSETPKRQAAKTRGAAKKPASSRKPAKDPAAPKTTRRRKSSPLPTAEVPAAPTPVEPAILPAVAAGVVQPTKFFLGREGVAFGPYSEYQLREGVRLGIFERADLALAEDGTEWREISQLLPANPPPTRELAAAPVAAKTDAEWMEVSLVLPSMGTALKPRRERRGPVPLSAHHLREHALLCASAPAPSLMTELTRGRYAFAAVPVVAVVLLLVSLAAVLKGYESAPRVAPKLPVAVVAAKTQPPLGPVSLPFDPSVASAPWLPGTVETGANAPTIAGGPLR